MKLAEQEAELGKRMEKKQKKARKNAINDRQLEIQNDTLDAAGYPQATMLKASELLAKLRSKGKSKNRPDSDFDPEQLKMGTAVEMEHGLGKEAAKEIAKDHLAELPDYYTRLKKMEAKKSLDHRLVVLVKAKYLSRKKVNGKWVYKYKNPIPHSGARSESILSDRFLDLKEEYDSEYMKTKERVASEMGFDLDSEEYEDNEDEVMRQTDDEFAKWLKRSGKVKGKATQSYERAIDREEEEDAAAKAKIKGGKVMERSSRKKGDSFDVILWGKPETITIVKIQDEAPRPGGFNPDRTPKEYVVQDSKGKKHTLGLSELKTLIKKGKAHFESVKEALTALKKIKTPLFWYSIQDPSMLEGEENEETLRAVVKVLRPHVKVMKGTIKPTHGPKGLTHAYGVTDDEGKKRYTLFSDIPNLGEYIERFD
jgi:hypothetical protein